MRPTQKELLNEAKRFDTQSQLKMTDLAEKVVQLSAQYDTPFNTTPIEELQLTDPSADPFNGNLNNRRVAARIARRIEVTTGDPIKAAEDVKKSLEVNPETAVKTGDELPELKLVSSRTPTPGSPAAAKAEAQGKGSKTKEPAAPVAATGTEGKPAAAPQWKPNA